MANFTFGSDPEFMLIRDGIFRSAIGIVPGTKYKRHRIGDNYYYYDNVMAECTIEPAASKPEALANFERAFRSFAKLVKPNILVVRASQEYPREELAHKDALEIGCDREFCCYALRDIEPPEEDFQSGQLRSAGGHLHIGSKFAQESNAGCLATIRMMDLFLGTMSIYLDKDETTKRRKELYGQAGRFRTPEHGAEYRSLGNFWLASPKSVGFIYDMVAFIMQFVEDRRHEQFWFIDEDRLNSDDAWNEEDFDPASCHQCTGYDLAALRYAIDTVDKKQGRDFLSFIEKLMPARLFSKFGALVDEGPFDFYKEWGLA
jgi:hypothetical protein